MIGNKNEENQKDDILQQLSDILDTENWGGNDESLILELVFSRKFDCRIFLRKKFKKRI